MSPTTKLCHSNASVAERPCRLDVILSFDIEEHHRIEAARGLNIPGTLASEYLRRTDHTTRWLLDQLSGDAPSTFFIVGQIARDRPGLVRAIAEAGHEVASHSWAHQRVLDMSPEQFRTDLRTSKDALEQAAGQPVVGFRAPTFSITSRNPWAIDVLVEEGFMYDSSIFPVHHDRYGVPHAPRDPFLVRGERSTIRELPPATYRLGRLNIPTGGGGYFRLLPRVALSRTLGQIARRRSPAVAMLYFHPWEFDPDQPRLPLNRANRFRTYVGQGRSRSKLAALIGQIIRSDSTFRTAQHIAETNHDIWEDATTIDLNGSHGLR